MVYMDMKVWFMWTWKCGLRGHERGLDGHELWFTWAWRYCLPTHEDLICKNMKVWFVRTLLYVEWFTGIFKVSYPQTLQCTRIKVWFARTLKHVCGHKSVICKDTKLQMRTRKYDFRGHWRVVNVVSVICVDVGKHELLWNVTVRDLHVWGNERWLRW